MCPADASAEATCEAPAAEDEALAAPQAEPAPSEAAQAAPEVEVVSAPFASHAAPEPVPAEAGGRGCGAFVVVASLSTRV